MNTGLQDLRYAGRMMRKSPGATAVMLLSLAVGIGATTAMFSVMNGLLLRPLGFPQPERITALWLRAPGIGIPQDWLSPGQFHDLVARSRAFDELGLAIGRTAMLTGGSRPERLDAVRCTSPVLDIFGAKAALGRPLLPQDDQPGETSAAVLSYGLWTRLFGADPQVLGRSLTIDGRPYTVVGVLEPSFVLNHEVLQTIGGIDRAEVFLPLPMTPDLAVDYDDENYNVVGRLGPGVSLGQAQADVSIIADAIRVRDHRDRTFTISVVGMLEQAVGNVRLTVLVMFGSVLLTLMIACANVANLLLSRAMGRQKEFAVRMALGASPGRLLLQLLSESLVLGVLGGCAGLALAGLGLVAIRAFNPGNIPRIDQIGIDGRVLVFACAISALTSALFGLAPALRALKLDVTTALKSGGRSSHGGGGFDVTRHKVRSALVVTELALSVVMLVSAGLLVRSFVRLHTVSPGFSPDHVVSLRLSLTDPKYQNREARVRFAEAVEDRIANQPGEQSLGIVSALPLGGAAFWGTVNVEGYVPPATEPEIQADVRGVSPDYFRTLKIPLVKGRFLTRQDTERTQPVIVVDEQTVQRFWPREDPLGRRIRPDDGPDAPFYTIVGVVGNVKQYGLDTPGRITIYFAYAQRPTSGLFVAARTAADVAAMSSAMVAAIHSVDPNVAPYDIATMEQRLQRSLKRQRFSMGLLSSLAAVALMLAAVGVYGVLSYLVTEGTRDIGIRLMLGAQRRNILRLVLQHGLALATGGVVAGLAGALFMGRVMQSLLFEVPATDVVTFVGVAVALIGVALLASYVPARRALRVDPIVAIRRE